MPPLVPINPQLQSTPFAESPKLQDIVNALRTYPDLVPVLGASGYTQEPSLSIANEVMQRFLAQNMDWKFNRSAAPSFLTVALQQDYVSNISDLGWLEQAWRLDINNTANPKPLFRMEAVRDLPQTSYMANPFNVSWVPNSLAVMGIWQPNTAYSGGYQVAQTPVSPIQQFIDANGNILFIDSGSLKLSVSSPGVGGTPPAATPYGVSGSPEPLADPNAPAGTLVQDGTVTWTVADPNGIAFRISPIPPSSGIGWLVTPIYQRKPPYFTSLQNTIAPIPSEISYLFRQGMKALLYQHSGSKQAVLSYQQWEEALMTALRAADREREDACFYPSDSLTGGGGWGYGMPVGPAWPFEYMGY